MRLTAVAVALLYIAVQGSTAGPAARRITWDDLRPLQAALESRGLSSATFDSYVARLHDANLARVREGDLDHLIFYLLQSTHFTSHAPIEPATSAKALFDGLDARSRAAFLETSKAPPASVDDTVRARVAALLRAVDSSSKEPRLAYFRDVVRAAFPERQGRQDALVAEYVRVMRFLYEKEFVAARSPGGAAVADLYRSRGFSTDTAIEAGYLVYMGLGIAKSLEPDRRIRRVVIVGPGLDLAPRTGMLESSGPVSYQPWAVADALLGLGFARPNELEVIGADINPRVVDYLRRARGEGPVLTLVSGIGDSGTVSLTSDYRDYFAHLGASIGTARPGPSTSATSGHLVKTVAVGLSSARLVDGHALDVVTERLGGEGADLVIATNILPYFDDVQLMLAMTNVAGMLKPGGLFLHNEPRTSMPEITSAVGLAFEQSRHAVIASVRGAPPLADSVFLHRRSGR